MESATNPGLAWRSRKSYRDRATRFDASRNDASLAWKEASLGVESEASDTDSGPLFALLLDISQTGASIALDQVPRASEEVWLRLEGEGPTDWNEARVVGVETTTGGPHLVRLAFREPCPLETLLAAICD
jgi:PilZ domain